MLFSFLPSVPLGVLKVTTALVVLTALAHQFHHAVKHLAKNNAFVKSRDDFFHTTVFTRTTTTITSTSTNQAHGNNNSFGACLMVKDDNDLLYEWIAYHYTVLPLRFLVVGVDVNSTQDPTSVLRRWSDADTDLQYWVLNSSSFDIYTTDSLAQTEKLQQQAVIGNDNNETFLRNRKDRQHHALITRQKGFVTTCSKLLKAQGVRWTTYIDSDEFVVPNILTPEDQLLTVDGLDHYSIRNESFQLRSQLLQPIGSATKAVTTTATVLDILIHMQTAGTVQACYTVPRLIVGALENQTCPESQAVKEYYTRTIRHSYDHMSTLRFLQHAKKGDFAQNKFGKVFMDLSRIPNDLVRQQPPNNIHRPYREFCGPGAVHFPNAVFYLNHYIGSWERYSSRSTDGRRNRHEWEQRAYFNYGMACETGMQYWLFRFVQLVGEPKARALLGAPG